MYRHIAIGVSTQARGRGESIPTKGESIPTQGGKYSNPGAVFQPRGGSIPTQGGSIQPWSQGGKYSNPGGEVFQPGREKYSNPGGKGTTNALSKGQQTDYLKFKMYLPIASMYLNKPSNREHVPKCTSKSRIPAQRGHFQLPPNRVGNRDGKRDGKHFR